MSLLKRIVSDTAIYGTSSILARGLNYLLTFLIATLISTRDFGVFTDLYAMAGFMLVALTHGMETSFFRHVNLYDKSKNVFGTAFFSVAGITTLFLILSLATLQPVADALRYPDQSAYIAIFSFIIFFDVLSAVPFANLRHLGKAKTFAAIKITNILIIILMNVFFLLVCPHLIESGSGLGSWIATWYSDEQKVMYVFIANMIASGATFLLLLPGLRNIKFSVDKVIYKRMLVYALPMMVIGFAGVINEMFDRKILRFLLQGGDDENLRQVGIYGFAYKLSMIMSLFLQAYRYAVEPILFSESKSANAPKAYAAIMKYYSMAATLLFLLILYNLPMLEFVMFDQLNYNSDYRASFKVVPILLAANGFLGIYFNVATWYKVSDKTMYGALIALIGAAITIALNIWWVPIYGFHGSAWATLICYISITLIGLYLGQKFYPIPYEYASILSFLILTVLLYVLFFYTAHCSWLFHSLVSLAILVGYVSLVRKAKGGLLKNLN